MIGITNIFTSQSPAWIAATFHGMFSQRTDPVRRITGNPIHKERPKCTAPIQLLMPSSATKRAITQARTRHRTNSMSSFPAGIFAPAIAASGSMPRSRIHGLKNSRGLYQSQPSTNTATAATRSEEHTSELQSPCNLVCRLLVEKKKKHRRQLAEQAWDSE